MDWMRLATNRNGNNESENCKDSAWVKHVKAFAEENGLSYWQALKHPDLSKGYTYTGRKRYETKYTADQKKKYNDTRYANIRRDKEQAYLWRLHVALRDSALVQAVNPTCS
jgi:hypothetical protein